MPLRTRFWSCKGSGLRRLRLGSEHRAKAAQRCCRLRLEDLERRLCLSAELGFVITSEGPTSVFDEIQLDPSGNMYVSTGDEIVKYSSSREVVWTANVRGAFEFAMDGSGNIYATGRLNGIRSFGSPADNVILNSNGRTDTFVVKLDNDGHVLWGQSLGGAAEDIPGGIAVDSAGNVFATGTFQAMVTIGSETLISAGPDDVYVTKLSTTGQVQWARRLGGSSFDSASGIGVDAQGDAYLTGSFLNTATLGGSTITLTTVGGRDAFVAKITAAGEFSWAGSMGGISTDTGIGLAIDPAGYVVTAGEYNGTADFDPGTGVYNLPRLGSSGADLYITKLDLSGNFIWGKAIGGTSSEFVTQVTVGPEGSVYLTGNVHGTCDFDPSSDTYFVTAAGSDAYLATLDANGDFVAARVWGGSSLDVGVGVAVDSAGNAYVTGYFNALFNAADFDPGPGTYLRNSNNNQGGFLIQLTPPTGAIGDLVWNDLNANGIQEPARAIASNLALVLH